MTGPMGPGTLYALMILKHIVSALLNWESCCVFDNVRLEEEENTIPNTIHCFSIYLYLQYLIKMYLVN